MSFSLARYEPVRLSAKKLSLLKVHNIQCQSGGGGSARAEESGRGRGVAGGGGEGGSVVLSF